MTRDATTGQSLVAVPTPVALVAGLIPRPRAAASQVAALRALETTLEPSGLSLPE